MALAREPVFETTEADVAHRTHTLAWCNQLVVGQLLLREANPADEPVDAGHILVN